jgi:serine/threonine protein kinase
LGPVHKAVRIKDGKKCCIKFVEVTEKDIKMIEDEFTAMKNLDHPNIIKYFESFKTEKYFCLVFEFDEGYNLTEIIDQKLNEKQIIKIFIQILEGLKYLHSKNCIHRNIQPRNIRLSQNGQIKIIGFDLVRLIKNSNDLLKTFAGFPPYIAPEIVKQEKYGNKVDIWSLGVSIYKLATHSVPCFGIEKIFTSQSQLTLSIVMEREGKPARG